MTDREKAIVMAYTGYTMLTGDKLGLYYQYIQEKVGRPVMIHELAEKPMQETIHTLSKPDFVELCRTNDEPRVMTLEEVNALDWDYCYLEQERLPGKEYRGMLGKYIMTCVTWPSITAAKISQGKDNYGRTWRCWTSRPTDEQREAVKWDA